MPSSTSNFRSQRRTKLYRIPEGPHVRMACFAGLFLLILLVVAEYGYRHLGYHPTVNDNVNLWCLQRNRVYPTPDQPTIVVIGASRSQVGISPAVLSEEYPGHRVIVLSINGTPSYEVARDLCSDPDFNGTIIWDAFPAHLMPPRPAGTGKEYVDYYHKTFKSIWSSPGFAVETLLAASLQSKLCVLAPQVTVGNLVVFRFRPPKVPTSMQVSRHMESHYRDWLSEAELERLLEGKRIQAAARKRAGGKGLDPNHFRRFVQNELRKMVAELKKRGGKMIIVHMPITIESWKGSDAQRRKEELWDHIEPLSGIPAIHFKDYPELDGFDCPDMTHLDFADVPTFTRRLAAVMRTKLAGTKSEANKDPNP